MKKLLYVLLFILSGTGLRAVNETEETVYELARMMAGTTITPREAMKVSRKLAQSPSPQKTVILRTLESQIADLNMINEVVDLDVQALQYIWSLVADIINTPPAQVEPIQLAEAATVQPSADRVQPQKSKLSRRGQWESGREQRQRVREKERALRLRVFREAAQAARNDGLGRHQDDQADSDGDSEYDLQFEMDGF